MNKTVSSDGQEPCVQCNTPVLLARAVLVRELERDETPALFSNLDPYAPGVMICCSQACADIVTAAMFEEQDDNEDDDEQIIMCPMCGHAMMVLTDGDNSYAVCPSCELIDTL